MSFQAWVPAVLEGAGIFRRQSLTGRSRPARASQGLYPLLVCSALPDYGKDVMSRSCGHAVPPRWTVSLLKL